MPGGIALSAVVYAKDLARLSAFYIGVTGLAEISKESGHSVLAGANSQIVIQAIPAHIAATFEIANPPERREEAAVKLCFSVPSLQAARAAAARLGGGLDEPERQWQWQGATICDGYDPEGNVIQLREQADKIQT